MKLVSITSMRNNESKARAIAEGYLRTCNSRNPDLAVFILDRCTDNTKEVINSTLSGSRISYVLLDAPWSDTMFAAGRPRDYAIDTVLANYLPDAEVFCFLDGDCIPSEDLFAEHERIHATVFPYPCLVNGLRLDAGIDGTMTPDIRTTNKNIFTPGLDVVTCISDNLYVAATMVPACIGCNVSLNIAAIQTARSINKLVLGNDARTFASVFDGRWGGEDPYLAATLFRVGCLLVNANPIKSHVVHMWHPGTHRTNEHAKYLQKAIQEFRLSIMRRTLGFDMTLVDPNISSDLVPTPIVMLAYRAYANSGCVGTDKFECLRYLSRVLRSDHMATNLGYLDILSPLSAASKAYMTTTPLDLKWFQDLSTVEFQEVHATDPHASHWVSYRAGLFR